MKLRYSYVEYRMTADVMPITDSPIANGGGV